MQQAFTSEWVSRVPRHILFIATGTATGSEGDARRTLTQEYTYWGRNAPKSLYLTRSSRSRVLHSAGSRPKLSMPRGRPKKQLQAIQEDEVLEDAEEQKKSAPAIDEEKLKIIQKLEAEGGPDLPAL